MSALLNRTTSLLLTNKSGGAVAQGDVVIVDAANAGAFTTTTTGGLSDAVIGVVASPEGIANNAVGIIALLGYVPKINLSGSASLGDLFKTHTVAKQAARHVAPMVRGDFGMVLGTGTAPAAILFGLSNQVRGAHTIQNEGTPLTDRANLNFVGSGVAVTDDAGNSASKVTVPLFASPKDLRFFLPITRTAGSYTIAIQNTSSQMFNFKITNNPSSANGDAFTIPFYLDAGTYTFNVMGQQDTNGAITDWQIDGSNIATGHDWYAASAAYAAVKTQAGVVVSTSGLHTLTCTVNGKNASSSGYRFHLTCFWFS